MFTCSCNLFNIQYESKSEKGNPANELNQVNHVCTSGQMYFHIKSESFTLGSLRNINCECVIFREKNNIFPFVFQFLFERVEGISRATIIDLDAHQVSQYHYLSLCQCALLLRSWHWWQDNPPLALHQSMRLPAGQIGPYCHIQWNASKNISTGKQLSANQLWTSFG